MLATIAGLTLTVPPATAADAPPIAQVQIAPVGDAGIAGLAILVATDSGTSVQVIAVGAPPGLTATIHAGDCAAIDPAPTGLLGELSGGQAQATLPTPFADLADGAHVVAFHAGLDVATALGCGDIPAMDVASTPESPQTEAVGGSYTGGIYGFTVTWDAPWTSAPVTPAEGIDAVMLVDGLTSLSINGVPAFDGDATECLRNWEQQMLDLALAGDLTELTKLTVAQGSPSEGGSPSAAAAYSYGTRAEDGSVIQRVDHYECRGLTDEAILEIIFTTPADRYTDALTGRQAVLGRLTLPGEATPPEPDIVDAPDGSSPPFTEPPLDPVAESSPQPEPAPSMDPGCLGLAEWVAATTARLDRIDELTTEARLLFAYDYIVFVAEFGGIMAAMASRQASDPIPSVAIEANDKAIRMFELLEEAAVLQYEGSLNPSGNLTEARRALREGIEKGDEGLEMAAELRRELGRLTGLCGLPEG